MERADFGMSMVVAPAYLVYLKVSEYLNWFSFGMAEYCFQAFLIIVLAVVLGSFKRRYLFSFMTAFIYGNVLDIMMKVVGLVPGTGIFPGTVCYVTGAYNLRNWGYLFCFIHIFHLRRTNYL